MSDEENKEDPVGIKVEERLAFVKTTLLSKSKLVKFDRGLAQQYNEAAQIREAYFNYEKLEQWENAYYCAQLYISCCLSGALHQQHNNYANIKLADKSKHVLQILFLVEDEVKKCVENMRANIEKQVKAGVTFEKVKEMSDKEKEEEEQNAVAAAAAEAAAAATIVEQEKSESLEPKSNSLEDLLPMPPSFNPKDENKGNDEGSGGSKLDEKNDSETDKESEEISTKLSENASAIAMGQVIEDDDDEQADEEGDAGQSGHSNMPASGPAATATATAPFSLAQRAAMLRNPSAQLPQRVVAVCPQDVPEPRPPPHSQPAADSTCIPRPIPPAPAAATVVQPLPAFKPVVLRPTPPAPPTATVPAAAVVQPLPAFTPVVRPKPPAPPTAPTAVAQPTQPTTYTIKTAVLRPEATLPPQEPQQPISQQQQQQQHQRSPPQQPKQPPVSPPQYQAQSMHHTTTTPPSSRDNDAPPPPYISPTAPKPAHASNIQRTDQAIIPTHKQPNMNAQPKPGFLSELQQKKGAKVKPSFMDQLLQTRSNGSDTSTGHPASIILQKLASKSQAAAAAKNRQQATDPRSSVVGYNSDANKLLSEMTLERALSIKDDPEFAPFLQMIKMGVPRAAVIHRMEARGLDTAVLNMDPNSPSPHEHSSNSSSPATQSHTPPPSAKKSETIEQQNTQSEPYVPAPVKQASPRMPLECFKVGTTVRHTRAEDRLNRIGKVIGVHDDDAINGYYYTVELANGQTLQTESKNLKAIKLQM